MAMIKSGTERKLTVLEVAKSIHSGPSLKSHKSTKLLPEIRNSKYHMTMSKAGGLDISEKEPLAKLKNQDFVYNRAYFRKNNEVLRSTNKSNLSHKSGVGSIAARSIFEARSRTALG